MVYVLFRSGSGALRPTVRPAWPITPRIKPDDMDRIRSADASQIAVLFVTVSQHGDRQGKCLPTVGGIYGALPLGPDKPDVSAVLQ